MPFSSFHFVVGHLEKSFPESIMWEMGQRYYSFGEQRIDHPDQGWDRKVHIVGFSKVTTKSLASGTGFKESN